MEHEKYRNGSVLSKGTIIKRDHYQRGLIQPELTFIDECPNYRFISNYEIYGSSQPSQNAIMVIQSLLKGRLFWFNTR